MLITASRRGLALGILVALAAAIPASAAPARATLSNTVLHGLTSATALGPVAPSRPVTIGVGLTGRDAAGLARFNDALYDKHSASYHHFLTPAAFRAR
ncbi:MAG: Pro-kumamolisin, activation domain, partial [Solirubrobacteraceae bacterium]|nr:Pro-kumamolisin, activation domain [Solirubrobacteraceae bacterium]